MEKGGSDFRRWCGGGVASRARLNDSGPLYDKAVNGSHTPQVGTVNAAARNEQRRPWRLHRENFAAWPSIFCAAVTGNSAGRPVDNVTITVLRFFPPRR
jgi:hypothetical protein